MQAAVTFAVLVVAAKVWQCYSASPQVVLIKIGGSSITNKAIKETLDPYALSWFVTSLANCRDSAFIVVHGAGSFGHHTAKEYGLCGKTQPPSSNGEKHYDKDTQRQLMLGLGHTRLSVQRLNQAVISAFLDQGLPAVGISPCFGVPGLEAHGGQEWARQHLRDVVQRTVRVGLLPVLHGDAGLYGDFGAGILSGDTIVEILGVAPWVTHVVFITDVDGVYDKDPNAHKDAVLLRTLTVHRNQGNEVSLVGEAIEATGSTHEHDVTGGLKVSTRRSETAIRIKFSSSLQEVATSRPIVLSSRPHQQQLRSMHRRNWRRLCPSQPLERLLQ
jgi:isopentenyl phosphate kinase